MMVLWLFLAAPAETSLLNKLVRTSLVESSHGVQVLQRDPSSPLFSVKTFEELPLRVARPAEKRRFRPDGPVLRLFFRRSKELLRGIYIMGFNRPSKTQETALPIMLAHP